MLSAVHGRGYEGLSSGSMVHPLPACQFAAPNGQTLCTKVSHGIGHASVDSCSESMIDEDMEAPLVDILVPATGDQLAVGHVDGSLRLWNLEQSTCDVTLRGHRGAVSSLRYSRGGSMLASGGRDTDIVIWDVPGEAGLYRLRGHTNEVTDTVSRSLLHGAMSVSMHAHRQAHAC